MVFSRTNYSDLIRLVRATTLRRSCLQRQGIRSGAPSICVVDQDRDAARHNIVRVEGMGL
jgi:hypothetical protein